MIAWARASTESEAGFAAAGRFGERAGSFVGRYHLIEELGEGGFGVVWLARQSADVERQVALKVIKPGMDSREVIARFEAEREALARMTHPNIAAVLDAGTTADGRPYFVMELVNGPPITDYCDDHRLSIPARLALFIDVCKAVQHAHQKAFIHRDLKPGNVLVPEVDGRPQPKVIDFGIAKALGAEHGAVFQQSLLRTMEGRIVGTPQYMSPEQTGAGDIDTRCDIYTLGVILYELLVGEPPLTDAQCEQAAVDELLRLIRSHEAIPPSARWKPRTMELSRAASQRQTEPHRFCQELRGDLDWIVLKALCKERERRYASASELADDLQRHLRNEPVQASPPSKIYRLQKLFARHRAACASAAAILLAILLGGGAAGWQWRAAAAARDREAGARHLAERREEEAVAAREAEAQARLLAEAQRQQALASKGAAERSGAAAQTARERAEDLINYLLFDLRDKLEPLGRIGLLEDVSAKAAAYFEAQPEAGETPVQRRNRGGMFQNRGRIELALGRPANALEAFQQFFRIMSQRAAEAPGSQQAALDLALAFDRLGLAYEALADQGPARRAYAAEFELIRPIAERQPEEGSLQRHLASIHERLGAVSDTPSDAGAHFTAQYEICARLFKASPDDPANRQSYSTALERAGDRQMARQQPALALPFYEQEVALLEQAHASAAASAPAARAFAVALQKQGAALLGVGKTGPALPALQRALDLAGPLAGADPGNLELQQDDALIRGWLARALFQAGRREEAGAHWREELNVLFRLTLAQPANPAWHRALAGAHWEIGQAHLRLGTRAAVAEARAHYAEGLSILREGSTRATADGPARQQEAAFEQALQETAKLPATRAP